jgi:TolB protein
MRRFLLPLLACAAAGAALAAPEADGPWLAYTSNRSGNLDVFLIRLDGSGARNLTNHAATDTHPAWSPDGKKIAFTSERNEIQHIFVMDADGGNVQQLTLGPRPSRCPAWSPDGKQIAFTREVNGNHEIFVMQADGSAPVNLTNHPAYDADPAWSPDGRTIAFASNRAGGGFRLYTIDAERGNVQMLSTVENHFGAVYPAWSPDGKQIAYGEPDACGKAQVVFVCDARGADKRQVTKLGGRNTFAAWSPDGKRLAFQHSDDQDEGSLYVIDADGANARRVGNKGEAPFVAGRPAWKPR